MARAASDGTLRAGSGPEVSGLYVYPVKSCGGISLTKAVLTPWGLGWAGPGDAVSPALDRQWCVVEVDDSADAGEAGTDAVRGFVQDIRIQPTLASVRTRLCFSGAGDVPIGITVEGHLAPGLPELFLPLAEEEYLENEKLVVCDRVKNNWFGRPLLARCAGPAAARWATQYLHATSPASARRGSEFRIARFCGERGGSERFVAELYGGKAEIAQRARSVDRAGFADCAAVHLVTEESLRDLLSRLPAGSPAAAEGPAAGVDGLRRRFRANVVVRGCRAAYVEDGWRRFRVGGALFRQLDATSRCVIPTTSPEDGQRDDQAEPRATLLRYRPVPHGEGPDGGPTFGIWLAAGSGGGSSAAAGDGGGLGRLSIGDLLTPAIGRFGRL